MIKPLKNNVVLVEKVEKTKSYGSIEVQVKEQSIIARVQSTGPDVEGIQEGQEVIYNKYSGIKIDPGDGEVIVIDEKDILGVVE